MDLKESQRLRELERENKKIAHKVRAVGYLVNKKQGQRIRREEGLQVPPPRPRQ
jgi:hypothetical protein